MEKYYVIECTLPDQTKVYYTKKDGFHHDKDIADTFAKQYCEKEISDMEEMLSHQWPLKKIWHGWKGCKREEININAVPIS